MARSPGRTGHRWRQARAAVLASKPPCSYCGGAIDYTADPRSRWAPSVDHIVKLEHGGNPLNPTNLRAMHYGCNTRRELAHRRGRKTNPGVSRPIL